MFLACYAQNGDVLWAKETSGGSNVSSQGIVLDNSGGLYVTGNYDGSFYGPVTFGGTSIASKGSYIAKYDTSGTFHWVRSMEVFTSKSIALDHQGNIFTTGSFEGTITIGSTTLTSSGDTDIFIAKFDSNGSNLWIEKAGGYAEISNERACGISTDSYGNCYITGYYIGVASFNSLTINSSGNTDIFLAKYNSNGVIQWVKSAGGSGYDYSFGVVTDDIGNSYITGRARDNTYFESTIIQKGLFVTRYDFNGNINKVESATSTGFDGIWGNGICLDNQNNCYVTGGFDGTVGLDNFITSFGQQDIFTWKLGQVVGIKKEKKKKYQMTFFPNPFSNQSTITTSNLLNNSTMKLFNSYGQMVSQRKNISGHNIILQRDEFPIGIYYIQIMQENKLINTGKVIIID